ncbi:caspase family protein [Streptomyces caeruleatus]
MTQSDPSTARAVIIGVGDYSHLEPLPAVANNVRRLAELLRDPDLWGLADEHCRVLLNPVSEREVLDTVHKAASEAEDAFLLYFAGHGLPEPPDALHLALPDASAEHLYRALAYDRVRSLILTACKARHKVVILDTCFSGRALKGVMGPSGVADIAGVDGTFLMTSSAENRRSMAPVGAQYTLFTGELLRVLERGDPDAGDLLDMDTIYRGVDGALRAGGGPAPQQRARNDGARIALVRNWAHAGPRSRPAAGPRAVTLEPGYEGLLHETVPGFVQRLTELAKSGLNPQRDAALAAVAMRWPEQQVAALLGELLDAGLEHEAALACDAVADRAAPQTAECLHVLDQLGVRPAVDMLIGALARTGPRSVALVAGILRDRGLPLAERLVRTALAEAGPDRSADMVVALHRHELDDEALTALRALVSQNRDPRYLRVADTLLAGDFTAPAHALYGELPEALAASRPPEETAGLLHAMAKDGAREQAETLLADLLAAGGPGERVGWALALRAAGLDWAEEGARDLLRSASAEDVLRILDLIRRSRPAGLLTTVRWAIGAGRDAADTVAFTTALREYGLPLDAMRIHDEVADANPRTAAALIAVLRLGRPNEAARLVGRFRDRSAADRLALVAELRRHGAHDDASGVLADVLESPPEELLDALVLLVEEVDVDTLHTHLAPSARGEEVAPLLLQYWRTERQADANRLLSLLAERESALLEETLSALPPSERDGVGQGREPLPAELRPSWRGWQACLTATVPQLEPKALARLIAHVGPAAPPRGAADLSHRIDLRLAVAEGLAAMPLAAVLDLMALLRDRHPDPSDPGTRHGSVLPWVLETVLSCREDAALLLAELFEDARHAPHLTDELVLLTRTGAEDRVATVFWLLVHNGRYPQAPMLAEIARRADLLERLRRSGLSRGEIARIERASAGPAQRALSQAVQAVLQHSSDLHLPTVLQEAATQLSPSELAELLEALDTQGKQHEVDRVIAGAALRPGRLGDWLPDVLAILCGRRRDALVHRLVPKAVRRSPVPEATDVVEILRGDGMPDLAEMVDVANTRGRMTRWLHR